VRLLAGLHTIGGTAITAAVLAKKDCTSTALLQMQA
jgi:hypothetical protein